MKRLFLLITLLALIFPLLGQNPLPYFLTTGSYDPLVPDPAKILGYQPGEWHMTHDQLVRYMYVLESRTNKVKIVEYGRSHEQRPLFVMIFSDPANLERLDEIREQRRAVWDPSAPMPLDLEKIPGVLYQGYSVHGNEPSGANAAAIMAFHLAASRSTEVAELLKDNLVFIDPCFNPDGLNRFSSWVNQNKHLLPNSDGNSLELNEPWPGGRTNHYWFDLNRDYLMTQHPETRGRIALFREWMPEIFTDHHEMGSNNSFFFQPGIPSRVHPLTPGINQELTSEIGKVHARYLNEHRSLYYSKESYDDYFYGKGSTYPDVNGSIGILFEQASSRGHLRQTENGPLSFAFTIRNQVATSLSTQEAMRTMRVRLLKYKAQFFREARKAGAADKEQGILIGSQDDRGKNRELLRILLSHDIRVHHSGAPDLPYYIPYDQGNYYLIRSFFEERRQFQDSLFYDISAWHLGHALGLPWRVAGSKAVITPGKEIREMPEIAFRIPEQEPLYGYLIPWEDYYTPAMASGLLQQGMRIKFALNPFSIETDAGIRAFDRGTLFIPMQNMDRHPKNLYGIVKRLAGESGVDVYGVSTGQSEEGPDLGSNQFEWIQAPRVAILTGEGVNAYDAGSLWYLLETRYSMPVTMVSPDRISEISLRNYSHIILAGGISQVLRERPDILKTWVREGGILITTGDASGAVSSLGLDGLAIKKDEQKGKGDDWFAFEDRSDRSGAQRISGSIFRVKMDRSHPVNFGYAADELAVFRRGTNFYQAQEGSQTPVRFDDDYLLAGYVPSSLGDTPAGGSYISIRGQGRGKLILFSDNPNFRSYFWGSNRFLANALLFSRGF